MTKPQLEKKQPITIKDIAAVLGVSNATVSRALHNSPLISEQTKTRIQETARAMGYVPDNVARMMRGEASNLVGFILPDVQNHFYSSMAKSLAENVASIGLQLALAISEGNPDLELRHVRELRRARARGIIITPVEHMLAETAELLSSMQTVQLVRSHPLVRADSVSAQDEDAVFQSTQYLLEHGHRYIAYLGGGSEVLDSGQRRLSGYKKAMAKYQDSKSLINLTPPHPGDGYQAAKKILDNGPKPTGLVIGSSQLALGVLHFLREHNIDIGPDISVVCYDDPEWFQICGPGISTIKLPIADMAHQALSLIDQRYTKTAQTTAMIEEHKQGRQFSFPVLLTKRGSVRRLG